MIRYDDSYKQTQGSSFAVADFKETGLTKPTSHTQLHYHSDMELLFIDEGETVMQVAGRSFSAGKGSLILINPYEVHSGETRSENYSHRCICFDLQQLGLPDGERLMRSEVAYANHATETELLRPFFTACYSAVKNRFDGWEMRAKGNLLMMFSLLTDKVSKSVSTKEQTFAKAVLEYLNGHFFEDVTSADMAAVFSYDHSYFCRKFKNIFSENFGDYLNGYRVSRAKELLSDHSVSQTATECGFQNISYFSRVFKAKTGVTPSEYKRKK